ncbi:unnamed protein product [Microthlaspi erraticum]|uniref:F-box domain-containing protein n=1 Tax=Microthlaspi erraticum TaxID=1685480 RepID=A0A6D2ICH2_9BRAS|nr:unnamed protein product [Microthlaspi erraticum]
MEERKATVTHVERRAREDLISELPNSLISQILSYLPTKEAVRTSVLSNRWKSLWLLISGLDVGSYMFPDYKAFVSFVDRLLGFCREEKSCLHKLKLSIHNDVTDHSCVTRWIDFVATRKLRNLDVECLLVRPEFLKLMMPLSLYVCETLLHLRLRRVSLRSLESVSLPRLKTMCLEHNVYANDACLQLLISSCPLLEDLSIVRGVDDYVKVLRVHSQSLASLSIKYTLFSSDIENSAVLIEAPRLKYLNFEDDMNSNKTISNSGSLTKVNLLGSFFMSGSLTKMRDFFTSISGVKDMNISWGTFRFIEILMAVVPLPQFCNLSCLEAELQVFGSLAKFLELFPSLRSLVLELKQFGENHQLVLLSSVPECLRSSLEFVELKTPVRGADAETKLIKYLLENSAVLKKFKLRLGCKSVDEESTILMELMTLRRCSASCEVFCST